MLCFFFTLILCQLSIILPYIKISKFFKTLINLIYPLPTGPMLIVIDPKQFTPHTLWPFHNNIDVSLPVVFFFSDRPMHFYQFLHNISCSSKHNIPCFSLCTYYLMYYTFLICNISYIIHILPMALCLLVLCRRFNQKLNMSYLPVSWITKM